MGRPHSSSAGKVESSAKISRGSNSLAEAQAQSFGLTKTSGYRSPEESVKVGGHANDDHTKGMAEDFAGTKEQMDKFAHWALKSGKYTKVIWQGKNLVTGTPIAGHYDHVHVSW